MKKITVITLVVIMLALSVVPALAAGGPPANRGTASGNCTGNQTGMATRSQANLGTGLQSGFGIRAPYALAGTISAIDSTAKTLTITVACGNRLANPSIGSDVTVQTTDATRFLLRNADGSATLITFADLSVNQSVSSHGSLIDGIWTASRVTEGALLSCLP